MPLQLLCEYRPQTSHVPGLESMRPHKSRLERDKENAAAAASANGPATKLAAKNK